MDFNTLTNNLFVEIKKFVKMSHNKDTNIFDLEKKYDELCIKLKPISFDIMLNGWLDNQINDNVISLFVNKERSEDYLTKCHLEGIIEKIENNLKEEL